VWPGLQIPLSWVDPQVMNAGLTGPRVTQGHRQALTEKGKQCPSVSPEASSAVDPNEASSRVQASILI
jgi:hypothetical protein